MLNRYMAPTDTDAFLTGETTEDQFNVDDIIDDLDRAYADGKEDLGRTVIEFLRQLAEEGVDLDEALERTITLIEDELGAKLVDEDGLDLADFEEPN